ncbi:hypothetical protein [Dyella psychrodurans]|uniref:Uncharacterized protein n=1 Tax=Dyella psychrodurans TaxID=1927960 RepID=A0A370XBT5_9GAMM|nr:hypothetical protein [Dyella psychrodurans]RDS85894.1 hypothetical protein DWU99_01050 [Dyella psychrodurans]
MPQIIMTFSQTAIYDEQGADARDMLDRLTERAQTLANRLDRSVEIVTNDGLVAETCHPESAVAPSRC